MRTAKAETESPSQASMKPQFLAGVRTFVVTQYRKYFTTDDPFQTVRSPQLILSLLLFGSMTIMLILFVLLIISFTLAGNHYLLGRIVSFGLVFLYLGLIVLLRRSGRTRLAAGMLVSLYAAIAGMIMWHWSINAPVGTLLLGFVIVLAGITLGSRYTVPVTAGLIVMMTLIQLCVKLGMRQPDRSSLMLDPTFGDLATYGLIFAILALVSWLSGRQMEGALSEARQAEAALLAEKKLLAVRLKERTRKLRLAQFREMRQLYRFAEVGQLTTALLHDLANHLTILSMDIEDLEQQRRSKAIERAKQSMVYLDAMVSQVRQQLKEDTKLRHFNSLSSLHTVVENLRPRAVEREVEIELKTKGEKSELSCFGDQLRFSQILTIVLTNALDAAAEAPKETRRRVGVTLTGSHQALIITVEDWGPGVPKSRRADLFQPFQSSKKDGMGLGLFIARQMLTTHFKGAIRLEKIAKPTTFIITIPKKANHETFKEAEPSSH